MTTQSVARDPPRKPVNGAPPWQVSLGGLMITTAIVAVYLAAFVSLFQDLGRSDNDALVTFGVLILVGPSLGITFHMVRAGRSAGTVLCRLPAKKNVAALTASACSIPVTVLGISILFERWLEIRVPDIVLMALLGGLTGAAIFALFNGLARSVNLCRNGIVYSRFVYFPWRRVNEVRWLNDNEVEFAFNRGWARWRAIVPPEQREAVERLLSDKLIAVGNRSHGEAVG